MFARALAPLALALSASATYAARAPRPRRCPAHAPARRRLVTVFNNCPHQVDPAFYPAVRVGRNTTGGFALQAFYETVVVLPDGWSGRMWGRTNCTARGVCATGQCFTGGENCTSPAPAGPTLAQFTLNGCARLPCVLDAADGAQIREPRLLQPVYSRWVQHSAPDRRRCRRRHQLCVSARSAILVLCASSAHLRLKPMLQLCFLPILSPSVLYQGPCACTPSSRFRVPLRTSRHTLTSKDTGRTPMAECTARGAGAGCGQTSTCPTGTAYTVRFC
jgi:hypothetical protein